MSNTPHDKMRSRAKPRTSWRRILRQRVYERDEYTCWICGEKVLMMAPPHTKLAASLDHIVPVSQGGKWTMDNLRTAHRGCNSKRGTG